jgi:ATP-dependent Lon protease
VGGTTLDIEACTMPGKGNLILTGQLGDVMKESASVALGYIRSTADKYGIDAETFEKTDIQLHVPEGAVPKDGPSAGITITLSMISAFTGRPVAMDIAMTGEITLHGKVLPIGGLKEKILAAKLAHISNVIIPNKNLKDLKDIDAEILEGMNITGVEHMDKVIELALRK